jgi:hypothetical protein
MRTGSKDGHMILMGSMRLPGRRYGHNRQRQGS